MKKSNILPYPQLSGWLDTHIDQSKYSFVKVVKDETKFFLEFDLGLPEEYRWKFSSVDAFKRKIEVESAENWNKHYWGDFLHNIQAYSITSSWRASELLKPAIRALNAKELVSAGVLARSLIELASAYIWNSSNLQKQLTLTKNELIKNSSNHYLAPNFEEFVIKMLFGTRMNNPDDYLKQVNIFTIITKLSKTGKADELKDIYDYLCEVAHPSVVGNARFWAHIESIDNYGFENRVMHRNSEIGEAERLIESILWSISWSSCAFNMHYKSNFEAIKSLGEVVKGL